MKCTDRLMEEHALILEGLRVLGGVCRLLASGRAAPPPATARLLELFDQFTDRVHHAREEELLFPALVEAGVRADSGSLGIMRQEHAQGRALLAVMREALPRLSGVSASDEARRAFLDAADYYRDHLAQHVQKEDQVLFRIADQVLDARAAAALDEAFEQEEAQRPSGLGEELRSIAAAVEAALPR